MELTPDKVIDLKSKEVLTAFFEELRKTHTSQNIDELFLNAAKILMQELALVVGKHIYQLIEIEFYLKKPDHIDLYTHGDKEQLSFGKWYFNGMGLDITFGNEELNIYGGILIRGIKKITGNEEYISGPSNVLKAIFSAIGNIEAFDGMSEHGLYGMAIKALSKDYVKKDENSEVYSSTRIGLTKKETDEHDFISKKYRFLAQVNLAHKFKDKTKVVKQLVMEKKLDYDKIEKIMGYKISMHD